MNSQLSIIALLVAIAAVAATSITTAYAINDKFTTDCEGPGNSGKEGDCPGGSEGSGPHDEVITNPSGKNQPPGQQPEED